MTRGTSSSQVGLFSTQISEQIVRLRALSRGQDGPSEAHQVDLRRAVMATRLLAGSARIMQLEVLPQFLEELLEWLQSMEQSKSPLNTTQALILESVVELEESLMLHLDEVEQETGADLSPFQSQVDDLLTLIRHNTDKNDGPPVESTAAAGEEPDDVPVAGAGPDGLLAAADWFDQAVEGAATEAELGEIQALLAPGFARLEAVKVRVQARLESMAPGLEPGPMAEGLDAVDEPREDAVFGAAAAHLDEAGTRRDVTVVVEAFGDSTVISEGLRDRLSEILLYLAKDLAAFIEPATRNEAASPLRVTFALRAEDGRAHVEVVDDGPRMQGSPLLGDPDDLSMLGGLRRARVLLEQTQGLIRVAAEGDHGPRFVLSVPLDPDTPSYRVLTLEGARVAVPAALVDDVIDAAGLLYETDESGESVDRNGRSVPLADLAVFVDRVVPARGASARIAIVGSVEKRLGLGCEDDGVVIEASELSDAPAGWESVAYGAIDVDGEAIPVIDVKRLLTRRFRLAEQMEMSGSHVDSFVPTEVEPVIVPEEVDFEPESVDDASDDLSDDAPDDAPDDAMLDELLHQDVDEVVAEPREFRRALLVNQSEFRRRDLARTLEGLGLEVEISEDLQLVSKAIDTDEIDLLVTDLRLGQGGGESFHTLREKFPALTIVLTSSVAQQYATELAQKTGAHQCWLDPYRKSDLEVVLRELTD